MSLLPDGQYQNLEQQHKIAKDLLAAARAGDPQALARIRVHRTDAQPRLADAQLAIAREAGLPSWARFVAFVEIEEQRATLGPLFPRFTEDLRRVLFFSRYHASVCGSERIEPEHVLLGLLRNNAMDHSVDRVDLLNRVPLAAAEDRLRTTVAAREALPATQQIPFSDSTKAVFVEADRAAVRSGGTVVHCRHLLMGILQQAAPLPMAILAECGVTLEQVRRTFSKDPPSAPGAAQ